jgi:hypothetical protein
MLKGNFLQEMGDSVADILKTLTNEQLEKIWAVYHDKMIKIAYPSDTESLTLDREIWLDLRIEKGQILNVFSGPHMLQEMKCQSAYTIFNAHRDVRFSSYGARVYQRDVGNSNNGASIARKIVISRLGMGEDYLWKVLTDIYIATLVTANTTFTIKLDFEDGTSQYTGTLSSPLANTRQLCQHLIRTRPRGRIVKLTIEETSANALSIFNIGMLFEIQKRRLLRYT